jgi:hypothetical protein
MGMVLSGSGFGCKPQEGEGKQHKAGQNGQPDEVIHVTSPSDEDAGIIARPRSRHRADQIVAGKKKGQCAHRIMTATKATTNSIGLCAGFAPA